MTTYKDSGVDINAGDESSKIAYEAAKETFISRKGMIGEPVIIEGGFSGAMDFGDFYLVQNDDGIGTKVAVAGLVGKYDTLGYDLVAMVADDAVCVGAEVVSVSNTIDVAKVEKDVITEMMKGLKKACSEQKIIVPGGEIAELGTMVNGYIWNATAVGIVEKDKFIMGDRVMAGDKIIGLKSNVFRSNGLTLVRHILNDRYGDNWHSEPFNDKQTWGEVVLEPTIIYHNAILELIGRYKEQPKVDVKAVAHITGGGLPGNISRIVRHNNLGARVDNLPQPHEAVLRVIKMGNVSEEESYKTWNMGVGMAIVCNEFEEVEKICKKHGIEAYEIGEIVSDKGIQIDKFKF